MCHLTSLCSSSFFEAGSLSNATVKVVNADVTHCRRDREQAQGIDERTLRGHGDKIQQSHLNPCQISPFFPHDDWA